MTIAENIALEISNIPHFDLEFDYDGDKKNIRLGYMPTRDFQEIINPKDKALEYCDDIDGIEDKMFIVFNFIPLENVKCGFQKIQIEVCIFSHLNNHTKVLKTGNSLSYFFNICCKKINERKIMGSMTQSQDFRIHKGSNLALFNAKVITEIEVNDNDFL